MPKQGPNVLLIPDLTVGFVAVNPKFLDESARQQEQISQFQRRGDQKPQRISGIFSSRVREYIFLPNLSDFKR